MLIIIIADRNEFRVGKASQLKELLVMTKRSFLELIIERESRTL